MGEVVYLIQKIREDKNAFGELIEMMEPLINKYVRLLYKDEKEDTYSEMLLALWEATIKIEYFENDGKCMIYGCYCMNGRAFYEKIVMTATGVWISERLGLLVPMICLLMFLMSLDYISGVMASKKEALEHPNNKKYGLSSKKGVIGIYKKMGYVLTVFVAISMDYLIYKFAVELKVQYNTHTFFGLLVIIWFVINEGISILENVGRMGVELPNFLMRVLATFKNNLDEKSKKLCSSLKVLLTVETVNLPFEI